eukprot:Selendium_serpulae@DN2337_c0_g1_i2.p1
MAKAADPLRIKNWSTRKLLTLAQLKKTAREQTIFNICIFPVIPFWLCWPGTNNKKQRLSNVNRSDLLNAAEDATVWDLMGSFFANQLADRYPSVKFIVTVARQFNSEVSNDLRALRKLAKKKNILEVLVQPLVPEGTVAETMDPETTVRLHQREVFRK